MVTSLLKGTLLKGVVETVKVFAGASVPDSDKLRLVGKLMVGLLVLVGDTNAAPVEERLRLFVKM